MSKNRRLGLAGAIVGLLFGAYVVIAFLIARGVTQAEREALEGEPSDLGLVFEEVSFPSKQVDIMLDGWYIPAACDGPTVVFIHGLGSTRTGDHALEIAAVLNRAGLSTLLFDLRAHGRSQGRRVSGGYFERSDLLGAFDFLAGRGKSPGEVGLLGHSMGAAIALMTAAEEPGFAAVVADSPYANALDLVAQETARKTPFPEWLVPIFVPATELIASEAYGIELDELRPEESASKLRYPILVIHGLADERIDVDHGRRVHARSPAGSEIWLVPEAGHVDAYDAQPEEYVRRLASYYLEMLSHDESCPSEAAPRRSSEACSRAAIAASSGEPVL